MARRSLDRRAHTHPAMIRQISEPDVIADLAFPDADVAVLPERIESDVGIYRDEVQTLVKALKLEGIRAAFVHDNDHREWRGAKGEVLIPVIIGVATSFIGTATWAGFVALLRRGFQGKKLSLTVGRFKRQEDGVSAEWFEATGDGEMVVDALAEFLERRPGDE
jgi:hypothetical protein